MRVMLLLPCNRFYRLGGGGDDFGRSGVEVRGTLKRLVEGLIFPFLFQRMSAKAEGQVRAGVGDHAAIVC